MKKHFIDGKISEQLTSCISMFSKSILKSILKSIHKQDLIDTNQLKYVQSFVYIEIDELLNWRSTIFKTMYRLHQIAIVKRKSESFSRCHTRWPFAVNDSHKIQIPSMSTTSKDTLIASVMPTIEWPKCNQF